MPIMTGGRRAWSCVVSCLLGVLVWPGAPVLALEPGHETITRAAEASVRVRSALFLAVTRAGERLVAVGERGFVLLSDDGGRHWRQARAVPVSVTLTNVRFVSGQLGWAVGHGGVVLHSRDGGETWVRQLDGTQAAALILEEAQAGAAQGDEASSRRLREAEGLVADGPDKPLLGLHFEDAQRGWVVGAYGLALATDDGGRSWRSIMAQLDNPGGKHLYDIRAGRDGLVIAGEQGALFRAASRDGPFAALDSPYAGTYFGTLGAQSGALLAYGLRGNVYRSGDGGARWHQVEMDQDVTITSGLRLADGSLVLADESGRLLRSDDQGQRFSALAAQAPAAVTALVQTADGALVLSGARGLHRVDAAQLAVMESR